MVTRTACQELAALVRGQLSTAGNHSGSATTEMHMLACLRRRTHLPLRPCVRHAHGQRHLQLRVVVILHALACTPAPGQAAGKKRLLLPLLHVRCAATSLQHIPWLMHQGEAALRGERLAACQTHRAVPPAHLPRAQPRVRERVVERGSLRGQALVQAWWCQPPALHCPPARRHHLHRYQKTCACGPNPMATCRQVARCVPGQ